MCLDKSPTGKVGVNEERKTPFSTLPSPISSRDLLHSSSLSCQSDLNYNLLLYIPVKSLVIIQHL